MLIEGNALECTLLIIISMPRLSRRFVVEMFELSVGTNECGWEFLVRTTLPVDLATFFCAVGSIFARSVEIYLGHGWVFGTRSYGNREASSV